jgi:hypothetical protein
LIFTSAVVLTELTINKLHKNLFIYFLEPKKKAMKPVHSLLSWSVKINAFTGIPLEAY